MRRRNLRCICASFLAAFVVFAMRSESNSIATTATTAAAAATAAETMLNS
jgi:hypothetical protein